MSEREKSPSEAEAGAEITVGVRELKSRLSAILRQVSAGAHVVVTDHGRPLVRLLPFVREAPPSLEARLKKHSSFSWKGGKPEGLSRGVPLSGESLSDAILEDRR